MALGAISFGGLATGLDTQNIIAQLLQIRRAPIIQMEDQKQNIDRRVKLFGEMKSLLETLGETARKMDTRNEFASRAASSSSESVVSVNATSGASLGQHSVRVNTLAQVQRNISQGFSSVEDSVGTGTFSITIDGETTDIAIDAGTSSLANLKTAINNAGIGVNAAIMNDGGAQPYRLVLTSAESGTANAFTIDASGLGGGTSPVMELKQAADNATLSIDGIDIVSASNSVENAIEGLTIDLKDVMDVDDPDLIITVEANNAAVTSKIENFVASYNAVAQFINDQSLKDAALNGSSLVRTVQSRMRDLVVSGVDSGEDLRTLGDIGVSFNNDGTMAIDSEKLTEALAENGEGVTRLFISEGEVDGVATRLGDLVKGLTDYSSGIFRSNQTNAKEQVRLLDARIERMERSLSFYEETLNRSFSAMEQLVSNMQAQAGFLSAARYIF